MRYSYIACILLAFAFASCSDDPVALATPCSDDTGSVAVTVSDASPPVIRWDPDCSVAMLLIEEDASDQWLISTEEDLWDNAEMANLISPPVTYGAVPDGVDASGPAATLVEGTTYEVILWRVLPDGSSADCQQMFGQVCLLAVHEFVR
ncbi:MAG: hypothetical protein R3253_08425 [Longimicrobiales bacterium]|nr:hypothetical protein [Longimicrobiales bacterium]